MRIVALLPLFMVAVAAARVAPSPSEQRIIGGSVTTIGQYPDMAALLRSFNLVTYSQACGGSILNNRSILTAAHCLYNYNVGQWRVRVGSSWANSGGVVHNAAAHIMHANYRPNLTGLDNDIGIIRLASTISFNNNVRAASIAGSNYVLNDNQVVWATGWGYTAIGGPLSEQLRHVQVWTVNQEICAQRYRNAPRPATITANMLCSGWLDVGGRDQCQGDSGGPLYHNRVVVGICSFGEFCALAQYPGVNVRVSRYTSWIQTNA